MSKGNWEKRNLISQYLLFENMLVMSFLQQSLNLEEIKKNSSTSKLKNVFAIYSHKNLNILERVINSFVHLEWKLCEKEDILFVPHNHQSYKLNKFDDEVTLILEPPTCIWGVGPHVRKKYENFWVQSSSWQRIIWNTSWNFVCFVQPRHVNISVECFIDDYFWWIFSFYTNFFHTRLNSIWPYAKHILKLYCHKISHQQTIIGYSTVFGKSSIFVHMLLIIVNEAHTSLQKLFRL